MINPNSPNTQTTNPAASASLWGGIAGAASNIVTTLIQNSPKNRDANVRVAEANAREAEANAGSASSSGISPGVVGLIIGAAVLGLVLVFALKK